MKKIGSGINIPDPQHCKSRILTYLLKGWRRGVLLSGFVNFEDRNLHPINTYSMRRNVLYNAG
jgi:hypothetical protein